MKIIHVVGTRPNFMKIAPLMREMNRYPDHFQQLLVHTGQHYDVNMSHVFFEELNLPKPSRFLDVGSGSHAVQTAKIMEAFEPVLSTNNPDWVVVVGDVNSTLACALVATKMGIKVAHVEAGLRSRDRTMPEEINRLLTDQISDILFTPSEDANMNLLREGIPSEKVYLVGNVMIDTLIEMLPSIKRRTIVADMSLRPQKYIVVTLHRPSNVDNTMTLRKILSALVKSSYKYPVIFPVHPRTRKKILELESEIFEKANVRFLDPLGYLDFLSLVRSSGVVVTDSGGLQEETTFLKVPCLTVRLNTERPITVQVGTNRLVSSENLFQEITQTMIMPPNGENPEMWDGKASERIVKVLRNL
ncbi:MAG: UDP-2,3-diacetamido-2,3-dideoxy-D-glucuronate 2-epimerase [Microgenomates bacterium OLB22]|nr:MAG: UDP-2,3-diacetamido-2,3-dideoxy-D-glucuronate 2-epimerase [Microgenomates bacterium OLB22]